MAESKRLVEAVQGNIDRFLDREEPHLIEISPELLPYLEHSRSLLQGGKRFRALFCYWGWRAVTAEEPTTDQQDFSVAVEAATALEVFHAAALVHDDIIDNSDTRRGQPAAHRRFEALHEQGGWHGAAIDFGRAGAILLGDLLLGFSDELLSDALSRASNPERGISARREFNRMRTEVTYGQYLDVLEEQSWHTRNEADLIERAHRVIVYKSAKYSIEAPLAIGGALGGATLGQLAALRDFGLPLGVAYQLRDDLLGVFGDPEITGKPAGDDLREGKRTVLIALARTKMPRNAGRLLDEMLGDPDLTDQQVRILLASIRESGAVDQVERIIAHNVQKATAALEGAPLSGTALIELAALADKVSTRNA